LYLHFQLTTLKPQKGVACLLEQFCGFGFIFEAKLKEEKAFHMRKKHNYTNDSFANWSRMYFDFEIFWLNTAPQH